MKKIAVLTPIYNRKNLVAKLYQSLLEQTSFDFTWYMCDDGSTDGLDEVVTGFTNDSFCFVYLKKENGGKHTALNYALKYITEDLTIIVDSDDYLTPDAIEQIKEDWTEYENVQEVSGLCYYRLYPDGSVIGDSFPWKERHLDYINNVKYNLGITGDKAEVFRTSVLKKYPFPEFANERFLSECVVWNKISQDGFKTAFVNRGIYVCEYLGDGLTQNLYKHLSNSPKGWYEQEKSFFYKQISYKKKLLHYLIYSIVFFTTQKISDNTYKIRFWDRIMIVLLSPLGFIFSIKIKRDKSIECIFNSVKNIKRIIKK